MRRLDPLWALWPAPDPDAPVTAAGGLLAHRPVRGDVVRGPLEVVLQRRQVGLAVPPVSAPWMRKSASAGFLGRQGPRR